MLRRLILLVFLALLPACGEPVSGRAETRILLMGDSMMASNRSTGQAVGDVLQQTLRLDVVDRSTVGARYFFGVPLVAQAGWNLPAQFRPGAWDWVVLNGGGNDLLFGCGCARCDGVLNRLISADGTSGAIPALVAALRETGAQVIYVGYLRNPGVSTPIKPCRAAGDELDRRLTRMAGKGVTFVPMADLVPFGDTSFHQIDRIHPSAKGSRAIADRVAAVISRP